MQRYGFSGKIESQGKSNTDGFPIRKTNAKSCCMIKKQNEYSFKKSIMGK